MTARTLGTSVARAEIRATSARKKGKKIGDPASPFPSENCAFIRKLKFWPRITATGKASELCVEWKHVFSYVQRMRAEQREWVSRSARVFSDFMTSAL